MALDKLVDSTQLDADLTSVANAIRTKGGTSASLAFPAGFVSAIAAIPSGGGGSWDVAAGTITPSADTKTLSLSVDFDPQYVFVITDMYDLAQTSTWKNTFFISDRVDGYSACLITRYNNSAFGISHGGFGQDAKASYSNGVLELSRWNYSWLSGVTYKWFCVRAKT